MIDAHNSLEEASCALQSATEPIDTSTPSGRLIFHMLASFAEFERETIVDRTRTGMRRFFRRGRYTGRIPYGYDYDGDSFVVEEDEARVVRELMTNLAGGSTIRAEARRLNLMGVPPPGYRYRGRPRVHGEEWKHATVSKMVSRSTYVGRHVVKSGEEEIVREVPVIVDEVTWQKASQQVSRNKTWSIHTKGRNYLLSGLITCKACGTPYRGNGKGRGLFYYVCGNSLGNNLISLPYSHAPALPAEKVEDYVWGEIREFVKNPGDVIERLEGQHEETQIGGLEERRQHILKRLQEKRSEKDRYVKLYAKGTLEEGEADAYIQAAITEINHLSMLLGAVDSDIAASRMEEDQNQKTVDWLATLSAKLEEVEADTKEAFATRRMLTELLLDSITASWEETTDGTSESPLLEIPWNFDPQERDSVANTFVYVPNREGQKGNDEG
jgi:site-specific DNA recombinase